MLKNRQSPNFGEQCGLGWRWSANSAGWGGDREDGGGEQCDVGLGRRVAHGSVRLVGEQCGLGTGSDRSVAPPVMVLVSCAFRVRFAWVLRACASCVYVWSARASLKCR